MTLGSSSPDITEQMSKECGLTVKEIHSVTWRESKYVLISLDRSNRMRLSQMQAAMKLMGEKFRTVSSEIVGYDSITTNHADDDGIEKHPGVCLLAFMGFIPHNTPHRLYANHKDDARKQRSSELIHKRRIKKGPIIHPKVRRNQRYRVHDERTAPAHLPQMGIDDQGVAAPQRLPLRAWHAAPRVPSPLSSLHETEGPNPKNGRRPTRDGRFGLNSTQVLTKSKQPDIPSLSQISSERQ